MVYRASQSGAGRARVRGREVAGEGKVVAVAVIGERALDPAAAGVKIHGYARVSRPRVVPRPLLVMGRIAGMDGRRPR